MSKEISNTDCSESVIFINFICVLQIHWITQLLHVKYQNFLFMNDKRLFPLHIISLTSMSSIYCFEHFSTWYINYISALLQQNKMKSLLNCQKSCFLQLHHVFHHFHFVINILKLHHLTLSISSAASQGIKIVHSIKVEDVLLKLKQ